MEDAGEGLAGGGEAVELKGIFLTNAAQILERAGEEDLALAVMEKNQFTPLEEEVARFVKRFRPVMNKKEE